jgi:hypothetical protein
LEAAALIHRMLAGDPLPSAATAPAPATAPIPDELQAAWVEHAATTTIKRMRDEARALGRYQTRTWSSGRRPPCDDLGPLTDEHWSASLRREAGTALRRIVEFGLGASGLRSIPLLRQRDDAPEPDVFQALLPETDAYLRLRLPPGLATDFLTAIEAARDATEARAASTPWDAPWPESPSGRLPERPSERQPELQSERPGAPPSAWAARIAFIRGRRAPLWVGLFALLEEFAATWDTDAAAPERRDDRVFIRDGWRCAAPGCSSRRHLEDHHVVYRSRGGGDGLVNRVTLCRFHHQRGEHGGLMSVRGTAPLGLAWRLGRDDLAVAYRNERRCSR